MNNLDMCALFFRRDADPMQLLEGAGFSSGKAASSCSDDFHCVIDVQADSRFDRLFLWMGLLWSREPPEHRCLRTTVPKRSRPFANYQGCWLWRGLAASSWSDDFHTATKDAIRDTCEVRLSSTLTASRRNADLALAGWHRSQRLHR